MGHQMRIDVAGAGAGKTYSMATRILECGIPDGQIVFCVAFTNAAANNINKKLIGLCGSVPDNVKVSTIHSFLYAELIRPYYHLLFDKRYQGVSIVGLPDDVKYRNTRISELDKLGLVHQTVIPRRAKWVVDKKTGDKAPVRALRTKVLALFASYCNTIFLDEAQDIDKDIKAVLMALDNMGVNIELSGDPKQDVKGHNCFRELIGSCKGVRYSKECHRCPELHLRLSNTLAEDAEKQVADIDNRQGSITVYLESETDVASLISKGGYGLVYISRKNERFETHIDGAEDRRYATLHHEIAAAIRAKLGTEKSDLEVNRTAYYVAERMLDCVDDGSTLGAAINPWFNRDLMDFDVKRYAKIADAIKNADPIDDSKIVVGSIEAVKGLEHEKCLFILTRDLAPYLIGEKDDDNKMNHLLYVALTRSLDELSILVTSEVEEMYSRERIFAVFEDKDSTSQPALSI